MDLVIRSYFSDLIYLSTYRQNLLFSISGVKRYFGGWTCYASIHISCWISINNTNASIPTLLVEFFHFSFEKSIYNLCFIERGNKLPQQQHFKGGRKRWTVPNANVPSELNDPERVRKMRQEKTTKIMRLKSKSSKGGKGKGKAKGKGKGKASGKGKKFGKKKAR